MLENPEEGIGFVINQEIIRKIRKVTKAYKSSCDIKIHIAHAMGHSEFDAYLIYEFSIN